MALGGAPLFAVILGAATLGFYTSEIDLAIIPIEVYRIVDTPLLVALPLFTFMGYLLRIFFCLFSVAVYLFCQSFYSFM